MGENGTEEKKHLNHGNKKMERETRSLLLLKVGSSVTHCVSGNHGDVDQRNSLYYNPAHRVIHTTLKKMNMAGR